MSENPPNIGCSKHHRRCALCDCRKIIGIGWHRTPSFAFCKRCWPYLDPTVEWFEARNEVLRNCIGQVLDQKPPLFKLLGQGQAHVKIKDGEWLTDQVIRHLSLPRGDITFEFAPLESPVAGTVEFADGKYHVRMSKALEDNFRAVSAVLIHEMMHIYLISRGISHPKPDEYEEATDLACVLMGFGIPMLNAKRAWQVDRGSLGARGGGGGTSYHIIGYLSEQQIGYAFAVFLADQNLSLEDVERRIDPQCRSLVTEGLLLERTYRGRVVARRKARDYISEHPAEQPLAGFSCPACLQKMAVPTATIQRIGILKLNCPNCRSVIHFDGTRIVRFIGSLR